MVDDATLTEALTRALSHLTVGGLASAIGTDRLLWDTLPAMQRIGFAAFRGEIAGALRDVTPEQLVAVAQRVRPDLERTLGSPLGRRWAAASLLDLRQRIAA